MIYSLKGLIILKIKFKKLTENAVAPTYGSKYSAGADLYAVEEVSIKPGETAIVHTGLALEIPNGYGGFVFARSGLAAKRGLAPANKVGVIDADYRGEIMVSIYNQSGTPQKVERGERIAQLVIMPFLAAEYIETETLSDTERGAGGFGSTGTK